MFQPKKSFLVFSVFILISFCSYSQQYNFKNYTAKNGLGSSIVNNIFQDSKGYIWFATQGGGVSRFNGVNFKNFTKDDGLISNNVTVITEDINGNIWIGTAEGVSKFNGTSFTNFSEKQGLPQAIVYSVFVDDKNKVWIGFREGGIRIFDGTKFDSLTVNDGLPSNRVYSIRLDNIGNFWFSCSAGIAKYDGTRITNYGEEEILKGKKFFSAHTDNSGNIWFGGVYGSGIIKYNGKTFSMIELPPDLRDDLIGSITQDKKGNIWFATNHGVIKYRGNKFTLFSEKEGLSVNDVLSVASDYEGNVWIGTQGGGVNFFNNEAFVNYTEKDGLAGSIANCIVADTLENIYYVGTPGKGLNVFNPNSGSEFNVLSGIKELEGINIYSLNLDNKGLLWVGSQEGVFVLEKKGRSFRLKKTFSKVSNRDLVTALKIIQDKKGNHWIASFGSGVVFINDTTEKYFGTENGFASDNIMTVFEDSKSTIWIGTLDAGVFKYNGKSFEQFSPPEGFPDKAVWTIAEDNKGTLYFGTGESGLYCFDGKKLKTFTEKDGICSNYINALEWDNSENCLWVGSEKGTNKVTFTQALEIESIRTFREQEGFKAFEINQNAILIDRGLVWFGSVNGLSRYDKKQDIPNSVAPKIQLSEIRLGYKTVDWKNYTDSVNPQTNIPVNLQLSYKNNHLVFDFQALTTDDVQYTFMLEGQDEDWSPLTKNTEASYSNITPGNQYTFKVKARNSNGVWSQESIPFTFTINPPWWTTWWFRLSVFIAIVGLVTAFIKGRERVLKEQNRILENTVTERTAEVVHQKKIVEEKNKHITDSIEYALRIQTAILPPDRLVKQYLKNSFILYLPKAIVAGDFYWMETLEDKVIFAACDCTGHGVSGAMVSVMCHNALNRAVKEYGLTTPSLILDSVSDLLADNFLKSEEDIQDGMDASLCCFYPKEMKLQWSGAQNPLWIIRDGAIIEYKPNKQSIGKHEETIKYTNHIIDLKFGDAIYIFSDGYADQFDTTGEEKLTKKGFKNILLSIQDKPMEQQREELKKLHIQRMGNIEQTDDVCVIGVRV